MGDINEKKRFKTSWLTSEDNDKQCIYGVATAYRLIYNCQLRKQNDGKSELADIIKGEMNKDQNNSSKNLVKQKLKP